MKLAKLLVGLVGISAIFMLSSLISGSYIKNESALESHLEWERSPIEVSLASETMLIPISNVSKSDVLLDISQNSTRHIPGSIVIPYTDFTNPSGLPKSVFDISDILGAAGISRDDDVVIYGECLPCGGGPAPATYIYWIMKSLEHKNVKVLDGNIEDWVASGHPTSNKSEIRPTTNYTLGFTNEFIAFYENVSSGEFQIVDARTFPEFNMSSIPNAINIPYDDVLDNHNIKNETALKSVFAVLSRDKPVVVFTNTGVKASVIWFALELMGYNAMLYSFEDWINKQANEGNSSAQVGG